MARPEYGPKLAGLAEISVGTGSLLLALVSGGIAPTVIFGAMGIWAIRDGAKRFKNKD